MTDESIFTTALDITDLVRRAAYLEAACADPARRARVEQLLAASGKAGEFLERPAAAPDPAQADTRTLGTGDADPVTDACAFLQPSPRPGALGRIGHYDVLEVLGRGGFGVVFRAFDDTLQRVVAVKVLAPSMAATSPARKRFTREARSSAQVRHENVVQVYEVSRDDEPLPYLVMEFIPGETLQQRLDRTGPLAVAEVVRIGRQIAEGLAAAHETGLIHRDVKPANVLLEVGPHERAKLTDFGLARAADDASISQSGIVAGTPMYMSPEQARGEVLDHRSDLFSLGSVLYTMLSGRPPFRASGTLAVLKRVCEEQPRPIREVIPEVPEWLCRIVEKLHAKSPEDRFQTAREVADLLADCEKQLQAHGALKDAARIPAEKPAARHTGSRWKRAALAAVAFAALFGAVWAGPHALRYSGNRAEVEFPPDADVVEVVLTAEGEPGERRLVTAGNRTVQLPPGAYRVEAKCRPGRAVEHWEVTVDSGFRGWFSGRTHPRGGETFVLGVNRGERFTVRPVTDDLAAVEKRNRDAIDGGRLAEIAKAVHAVGTDGWVQLFNGKDLTGWKTAPDQPGKWAVKDGGLTTSEPGFLFTERGDYGNFHLRVEARVNVGGVGSIFFRAPFAPTKVGPNREYYGVPECYQIALHQSDQWPDRPTGSVGRWGPPGSGLPELLGAAPDKLIRPNEWFKLDVIADGNRFVTKVNDEEAANGIDPSGKYGRGHIALHALFRDTAVEYRKIEIKELPPSPPAPEGPAPAPPTTVPSPAAPVAPPLVAVPFGPKKAAEYQEAWAMHLGLKGVEFTDKKVGMEFRVIPPGDFQMGARDEEVNSEIKRFHDEQPYGWRLSVRSMESEKPRHPVRITRPFALGKYEVTVGQFKDFVKDNNGYKTVAEQKGGYGIENGKVVWGKEYNWKNVGYEQADRSPVWNVTRDDAVAFCKWLSEKDGRTFRLPTEAEWEWACRAGTDTRTFWGTDKAADAHQYAQGSANNKHQPQPVGGLRPNPFGLYDMCGNVWEWCDDWYGEFYYKESPGADPRGPAAAPGAGFTRHRVQRGGSVDGTHHALTSTVRKIDERPVCGFRVVCEIAGDVKLPPPEPKKSPGPASSIVAQRRKEVEARSRARDEVALRLEAGVASKLDLLAAEVELTEARIKLAETEKVPEEEADLLEELVAFRQEERELIALRVKVGVELQSALDRADARLADAKARLVKLRPPEPVPEPRPKP